MLILLCTYVCITYVGYHAYVRTYMHKCMHSMYVRTYVGSCLYIRMYVRMCRCLRLCVRTHSPSRLLRTYYVLTYIQSFSFKPEIDAQVIPVVVIHLSPLKSVQPLYSGQVSWSQCVLYTEISLYVLCAT